MKKGFKLTNREKTWIETSRNRRKVLGKSSKLIKLRKGCKPSKGEQIIIDFLVKDQVKFFKEYFFKGCYNRHTQHLLFFDFYLPDYNTCIEFDGAQHYHKDKPENAQANDFIKNAFCKANYIYLLRIKYDQIDNIETIICEFIDKISG